MYRELSLGGHVGVLPLGEGGAHLLVEPDTLAGVVREATRSGGGLGLGRGRGREGHARLPSLPSYLDTFSLGLELG